MCQRGLAADARRHLREVQALPSSVPALLRPQLCAARAGVLSLEGADAAAVAAAWAEGLGLAQSQGNRLMQLRLALGRWEWQCRVGWPAGAADAEAEHLARADIELACSALRDAGGLADWARAQSVLVVAEVAP